MKRTLALTFSAVALAFSMAACGDDDQATEQASSEQPAEQQGSGRGPGAQPGSGEVAAVDGSTAQVQSDSSQTAVSWTDSTTFTRQVGGSLDDVAKGACVLVVGEGSGGAVTAASVRITEPVDGECATGFGGGRPAGGERPTDRPSGAPEGQEPPAQGDRPGGGMASGKVTAVSDGGFTVESSTPGSDDTSSVKVAVDDDTTYATTTKADAGDVLVGVCLQTRGETDSAGAVAATSIQISAATDGECSGGLGRRGGAPQEQGDAA